MKIHRNLTHRQEALAERSLYAAVASLRTPEECRAFLRDLCTPAEIQAMADRWAVVEWLQRGLPYREIHRVTGVSVTTIARVARFVASGTGGYSLATRRVGAARDGSGRDRGATDRAQSAPRSEVPGRSDGVRHA